MDILFSGATIVTMDQGMQILFSGYLGVTGKKNCLPGPGAAQGYAGKNH